MFFKKHDFVIIYSLILTGFTIYTLLDTFVIARSYMPETPSRAVTAYADTTEKSTEATESETKGRDKNKTKNEAETESTEADAQSTEAVQESTQTVKKEKHGSMAKKADSVTEMTTEKAKQQQPTAQTVQKTATDTAYEDGNISISLNTYRSNDTTVYAADVKLSSAQYLKTALAQGMYGRNITAATSDTAAANNAILAINGDYYGARQEGYVIRNGTLYRDKAKQGNEDLVIYADGSFEIISEDEVSAQELLNKGAVQVMSFGPALVENGEISVSESDEVGKAMASNPRTAIAVIDDLHYVFIVADGRTEESEGMSLYELACFAKSLGAKTVYNLDGGGSSTMYFNGKVINNPTTNGNRIKERSVSDIVYIG